MNYLPGVGVSRPRLIVGDVAETTSTIETFKWNQETIEGRPVLSSKTSRRIIDIGWLPMASEAYKISADPRDYVIAEVPLVTVDIPNRNMDCFSFGEISRWSPLLGSTVYRTFVGKPTYLNHDNKDATKARGANFDSSLVKLSGGVYKIVVLSGYDRTKDRNLAESIRKKLRNKFSMGAFVDSTICSVHGRQNGPSPAVCCTHRKGELVNGVVRYDLCLGVNFIENSSVEDPADPFAWVPDDQIW